MEDGVHDRLNELEIKCMENVNTHPQEESNIPSIPGSYFDFKA